MRRTSSCICLAFLFVLCNLVATGQTSWGNSDSWRVLVGSVASVDQKGQTIDLLVRSGTEAAPKSWVQEKSLKFSELQIKVMPEAVPLRLAFNENTKLWKLADSRLEPQLQSVARVEPGSPVLIELQEGQHWSVKETGPGSMQGLTAARVVLLQACIEESCTKAKCKDKKDCKEKVCDCPTPK